MTFVNEFIPASDLDKYAIKEIDKKFELSGTNSRQWTIDRGRDIYLRNVARGGGPDPDERSQTIWTLFRRGYLLNLRLDLIEGKGREGESGWSHWKLIWINGSNGLPAHLRTSRMEIIDDLKEALVTYQGAGVYSANYSNYTITLDIAEECVL